LVKEEKTAVLAKVSAISEQLGDLPEFRDNRRNESSTPPNSVLPSSPAIAEEISESEKARRSIVRAQMALYKRGYPIDQFDGELRASTIVAIFHFQADQGLTPNGRLTTEVLSALGIGPI
jgi:hypothetical protein